MDASHILNLIEDMPLLANLNLEQRVALIDMGEHRRMDKYEQIYHHEQRCDALYFLLDGVVKIATNSNKGREVIKFLLYSPDTFGEQGILSGSEYGETATSMSDDTHLLKIRINDFNHFIHKYPIMLSGIVNFLGNKVRMVERRLETQIFMNAKDRIVDFIREAAHKRGQRVGVERVLKRSLTQQEIANYTGTSRQTVTEVFNELKKNNQIRFNRHRIIMDDNFEPYVGQ